MPFCKNCNKEKMEMDMTFDDLCKNCFAIDDSNYYISNSHKSQKARKINRFIIQSIIQSRMKENQIFKI